MTVPEKLIVTGVAMTAVEVANTIRPTRQMESVFIAQVYRPLAAFLWIIGAIKYYGRDVRLKLLNPLPENRVETKICPFRPSATPAI
jgi:hypothetical protein